MAKKRKATTPQPPPPDVAVVREILGYLNFSSGTPDIAFQRNMSRLCEQMNGRWGPGSLRDLLLDHLSRARSEVPAFGETEQAEAVIRLALDEGLPAYRRFHRDLLFHLQDEDFQHPFFLARVFEAVLAQGPPWSESERIIAAMLDQLNEFVGYRPVAVLENGRRMDLYPHERFRPIPLYIRETGVGAGRYRDLIERTIHLLQETPPPVLEEAYFDLNRLDELALDVRAYDHTHPAYKRTNYMFGEWDPHRIDNRGYYRRFVVRRIILDSLLGWVEQNAKKVDRAELLHDAAAVLCGTMLMASAISGAGPGMFDSSVTLTSLLPKVARHRDHFYARLLEKATGDRARRLHREAELTQQPFGHVRQQLNIDLATYGARQVQHRHLALQFARMGYPEAAREQAAAIPAPSTRFDCEIHLRITAAHRSLEHGELSDVARLIREIDDHLHRGVECGAIIDPWNILGFQGQFPLFQSREDAVHDLRAEVLIDTMERIFGVYSGALSEAAARGERPLAQEFSAGMQRLADWWDRFATPTVSDLPQVFGAEHFDSATHVAQALSEWRAAGEAAGDIGFWRQHVDRFQSPKAYAVVVDALLDKQDYVAAMGLLMQWLSEADSVGLESGTHGIHDLLVRWMQVVLDSAGDPSRIADLWPTVRRLFDYLEVNAGEYWSVPRLEDVLEEVSETSPEELAEAGEFPDEQDEDEPEEEESLFAAAYEDVVFRDSTGDGHVGDTLDDGGYEYGGAEFEEIARWLDPRLKFLDALAQLWEMAGTAFAAASLRTGACDESRADMVMAWQRRARGLADGLVGLMNSVWDLEISPPSGDRDENLEYDLEMQIKFDVIHDVIATHLSCLSASRALLCCLAGDRAAADLPEDERRIVGVYRGVMRNSAADVRRALPGLLRHLAKQPLLYIPLKHNGHPEPMRAARDRQEIIRSLLMHLPRLGLLHETWQLLQTAYRMERDQRPSGQAVTEFDGLFRTALENSLACVIRSSNRWKLPPLRGRPEPGRRSERRFPRGRALTPSLKRYSAALHTSGKRRDAALVEVLGELVARYRRLWLKHSQTTRLSTVEGLLHEGVWEEARTFVERYGADLFHARILTLGNLRTIIHNSIDRFLEYLEENEDPLHPIALLEDLRNGQIDRHTAVDFLELIYGSVVDKIDRFVEYNTTTTQSDYGEMFYCLLDFLRVEAAYDRDAWNLVPFNIAHQVLSESGKTRAAQAWERVLGNNTAGRARQHLQALRRVEKEHGMRLPAVTDHLSERFVKPLAVDRIRALVPRAMDDARRDRRPSESFQALRGEIDAYLRTTSGSGVDIPPWLRSLEAEVERVEAEEHGEGRHPTTIAVWPTAVLSLRRIRRELAIWDRAVAKQ